MSDEPRLNEPRTWTGHWWRTDLPDQQVPGVLYWDPAEGLRLDLIGGWSTPPETTRLEGDTKVTTVSSRSLPSWPILHGLANGKAITLIEPDVTRQQTFRLSDFFGVPSTTFVRATTALIGCHLTDADDPAFIAGSATVENLTAWAVRSGIEMTHTFDAPVGEVSGQIELRRLAALEATIPDFTVKLHTAAWQPYDQDSRAGRMARVRERNTVEFASAAGASVSDLLTALGSIGDLVSLASLRACGIITTHLYLPPTPERYPAGHPLGSMRPDVEVYTRRIVTPDPDADAVDHRGFVMTLADLPFEELLPRWMEIHERFSAARGMVLGLRYVSDGYIETRVVTAVAAAESFHRALEEEPPMPAEEFAKVRKLALAAVPTEHRQWLANKLMRNEPTLKQRLLELGSRPGQFMSKLLPNPEAWARAAGAARNGVAHTGAPDDMTAEQMHAVSEVTAAVVVLNLLYELGIPEERLAEALENQDSLSFAATLAHRYFSASTA